MTAYAASYRTWESPPHSHPPAVAQESVRRPAPPMTIHARPLQYPHETHLPPDSRDCCHNGGRGVCSPGKGTRPSGAVTSPNCCRRPHPRHCPSSPRHARLCNSARVGAQRACVGGLHVNQREGTGQQASNAACPGEQSITCGMTQQPSLRQGLPCEPPYPTCRACGGWQSCGQQQ